MSQRVDADVVIIGAGVSGLFAAYHLQKSGQKVIVLEAKDRIGGRLCAAELKCKGGTDVWDMGGQWVGRTQSGVMDLIDELGMEVYNQYTTGKKKLMLRSPENIKTYSGTIPYLSPLHLLDIDSFITRINTMTKSLDLNDLLGNKHAAEWDSVTVHSYVNDTCKYEVTKEMIEMSIRIILGVDLSQISLFYLLYYCKQAGGIETLLEAGEGGAQEFRVKGSAFKICEKLAEKIPKMNLVCGDPVHRIDQTDESHVLLITNTGKVYKAGHVICAIPPHLVNGIEFDPPLSLQQTKLREQMPVGHLIKFVITYQNAFWLDKGLSGETAVTGAPCSIGPITVTFDGTTSNDNPAITGFICAEHALYWTSKSREERKEAVLESLSTMLGSECLRPIHYEDRDWATEPYNGGCPVSVMRPRGLLYFHPILTQPHGRVHWAGTESARVWYGYIDGGIEAGKRAADEILGIEVRSDDEKDAFFHHSHYASHFSVKRGYGYMLKGMVYVGIASVAAYYLLRRFRVAI